MTTKAQLLTEMSEAVVLFEEERVERAAVEYLAGGFDPLEAMLDGLTAGMKRVGELFSAQEYFVPEVLLAADAMEAGMQVLRPHVKRGAGDGEKCTIIIGSVEGDIHDIGKNLVKLMLSINGYNVRDLGADVAVQAFLDAQAEVRAPIVGLSAMMTTTMMAMKKIIPGLRQLDPAVKIMVGGAPMNEEMARSFGADGYARDASAAVREADRILGLLRAAGSPAQAAMV